MQVTTLRLAAGALAVLCSAGVQAQEFRFEPNRGQFADSVLFACRSSRQTVALTADELVVQACGSTATVRMRWSDGSNHAHVVGRRPLSSRSHYLHAHGRHADVPHYAEVYYEEMQPGIALRLYEQDACLKYDLVLAAATDPCAVALRFSGMERIEIDERGDLVLSLGDGRITQPRPFAYQEREGRRIPVVVEYTLTGDRVGFALGDHDPGLPTVIDPAIVYSTYLGGAGSDQCNAIATDAVGNTYVAGSAGASNFPLLNPLQSMQNGGFDAFVSKLDIFGNLVWSTYLGGSGGEDVQGIAVDDQRNVYVVGSTSSADFPVTAGAIQTAIAAAGSDVFVAKIAPSGTTLLWATYLGGQGNDKGYGIELDPSGRPWITGEAGGDNFPVTAGAFQLNRAGSVESFVSCLSTQGNQLHFSSYLGGTGIDRALDIAVDDQGAAYVAGYTYSIDFPTTLGAFQRTKPIQTDRDGFVAKVSGGNLVYCTYLGGRTALGGCPPRDTIGGVAVDSAGSAYVSGGTFCQDFPVVPGGFLTTTPTNCRNYFVTKLNATGSSLVYSTYLPGIGGNAIAVDENGRAHVAGGDQVDGLPVTPNALQPMRAGGNDVSLAVLSPDGSSVEYATWLGGADDEHAFAIALDAAGNAHLAGLVRSTDFPTVNAFQPTHGGPGTSASDGFVVRIGLGSTDPGTTAFGSSTPGSSSSNIGSTTIPQIGNANFTITCSGAPPSTLGLLAYSTGYVSSPVQVFGVDLWLDPSAALFGILLTTSDAQGNAQLQVPIPPDPALVGLRLFFQFGWSDPGGPQGFSGSPGLAITVQP